MLISPFFLFTVAIIQGVLFYSPSAYALEKVTLQLKWHHQFQFAGYYAAKELGFYKEAGLDVRIDPVSTDKDPIANVLDGGAQYGVGSSDLLMVRNSGKPVVVLAVIFQHSAYVLLAMQRNGLSSIQDLVGKKVMIDPYATEIIAYLKKSGIPLDRLVQIKLNNYSAQDLISGKADAYAGYSTNDPWYLDKAGASYLTFTPRSEGIDFYGDNLFTTESELKEHPDRAKAFLEASLKGWRYALENPEKTADLMIKYGYFPANGRDKLLFEADKTSKLIYADLIEVGHIDEGRWQHIAETYVDLKMLPSNFSLDGFLYKPLTGISKLTKWIIGVLSLAIFFGGVFAAYILLINRKFIRSINNLTYYDGPTGLPNRRMLKEKISLILTPKMNGGFIGAILFINLDNFKTITDNFGFDNGDLATIEIAKCIRSCIQPDDTLARVSNDEFVVLLDAIEGNIEQAAIQAEAIATKILNIIQKPLDIRGQEYRWTSCIGICLFQQKATFEDLLKNADSAMSQAKGLGQNKIHFFDAHMQVALEERFKLEAMLHRAIPEQLRLYYQLQVKGDGLIAGAEVLIRWQHPTEGMISPAAFIPIAEDTELILPIGRWVLETACLQLKDWEGHADLCHITLAVNVSAKQFHQDDFVEQVLSVLERTQANPTKLNLELTEGMLLQRPENVALKMSALKSRGVHFSLDDFGTGYSSLAYLRDLPLDQIKIDQSFTKDIPSDPQACSIVLSIIALAKGLGLDVIAEGVETNSQRVFLSQSGCFSYQGYLFSKPLPVEEFERLAMTYLKT